MKYIRVICLGVLCGFITAWVLFLAPATGPTWAARAWAIEEIAFDWLAWLLPGLFAAGTTSGMLFALASHFAFWPLLGGLTFWGVAILRAKALRGRDKVGDEGSIPFGDG